MSIYHVEVHSRDRQIEHYVVQGCENKEAVIIAVRQFYADRGQRVGLWDREDNRNDLQIPFLIFIIEELPNETVLYITGEYRSQFPI